MGRGGERRVELNVHPWLHPHSPLTPHPPTHTPHAAHTLIHTYTQTAAKSK